MVRTDEEQFSRLERLWGELTGPTRPAPRSPVPEWQARGVGTQLVRALLEIIRRKAAEGALVSLFTGRNLAEFYEQFGFSGPECGLYGMSLLTARKEP